MLSEKAALRQRTLKKSTHFGGFFSELKLTILTRFDKKI